MIDAAFPFLPPAPKNNYTRAAVTVFNEAVAAYIQTLSRNHFLNEDDRRLMLVAVNTLCRLDSYPLARALIRLVFSDLTADEMLTLIDEAAHAQRQINEDFFIPFK